MRVTFILFEASASGGTRVIAMLAHHMRQHGHDVFVASIPAEPPSLGRRLRHFLKGGGWLPSRPAQHPYLHGLGQNWRVIPQRRPIEDRDLPDADVVIATWWKTADWVARLSPEKGVKAYFIQQYEANFGQPEDLVAATWRLPLAKLVCSGWLADLARDRFGDPTAKVVPNGIDLQLFHAPERDKQPRPTVGLMYAKNHVKGFDIAWAALTEARRRLPDLMVRAYGFAETPPELADPSWVEYRRDPPQDELRRIYAGCDAWMCSSRSEGYHLPPHEAMACRCPVVSTRVGGPIELVRDGVNGYLVEVGDSRALTDRLVEVLGSSEDRWRQMSGAAYDSVKDYDWSAAARRFEAALAEVIAAADADGVVERLMQR